MAKKKTALTGARIAAVRTALGLNAFAFAAALGVHVSSVFRWEAAKAPVIDPLQRDILTRLVALPPRQLRSAGKVAGPQITAALLKGGTLSAFRRLLDLVGA